uniref:Gastrin/cholecystokinin peptide hormone domain-containing protein n=1 Tax=Dicentrarchus labrax TaxID=13489 RepID=A0A8P4KBV1_DICLA
MNVGICVCVLLAALSSGSLSLPSHTMSQRAEGEALSSDSLPQYHTRQARSAPAPPSGQLPNYIQPQEDADARNSLSQLLARLISRKGGDGEEKWIESVTGAEVLPLSHLITHVAFLTSCFAPSRVFFFPFQHPSFCNVPSLMLRLSPTIWHFPASL